MDCVSPHPHPLCPPLPLLLPLLGPHLLCLRLLPRTLACVPTPPLSNNTTCVHTPPSQTACTTPTPYSTSSVKLLLMLPKARDRLQMPPCSACGPLLVR